MGLVNRVIDNLEKRREKVLSGGINCIPTPFPSFRRDFPGIEQGKFYLISGASKSGKTQITSYLFLYTPVLYAYYHPDQIRLQVFYYPLEETAEKVTLRFMSYLLYTLSGHRIRISPLDLQSIDSQRVLDSNILEILRSIEYQSILQFYEEHVHFMPARNPTGYWKDISNYAEEAGTIHRKPIVIENKQTGVKQETMVFDYYEPKDPNEYIITIWDHAGNTATENSINGDCKTLKGAIDKLSEYFMIVRNKYNYTPVLLQQQNSETLSLDAYKSNKIRPTLNGTADSKDPAKACSMMLGITNPYSFELPKYPNSTTGYDITKLKGYARFLEVVLNREGESNGMLGLYFDGATNYFAPLPAPSNLAELEKLYKLVEKNSKQ